MTIHPDDPLLILMLPSVVALPALAWLCWKARQDFRTDAERHRVPRFRPRPEAIKGANARPKFSRWR